MLKVKMRPLTVHDYRELPDGPPHYQLVEGDLHMSPSPTYYHQEIVVNLLVILRNYLSRNPIGTVCGSPLDVTLTDLNVYQPDLFYVANEHRAILTDQGAVGAPDFVVEILSPKTAALDKGTKREIYARTGVQELWLVDPEVKRITVYYLQENAETPAATYGDKATFQSPLFPGLILDPVAIFKIQ